MKAVLWITLLISILEHFGGEAGPSDAKPYVIPALPPDAKKCEPQANGTTYEAKTNAIHPCNVKCTYSDGRTAIVPLEDNRPCCPVGPQPTGICKGGQCYVGGVVAT